MKSKMDYIPNWFYVLAGIIDALFIWRLYTVIVDAHIPETWIFDLIFSELGAIIFVFGLFGLCTIAFLLNE